MKREEINAALSRLEIYNSNTGDFEDFSSNMVVCIESPLGVQRKVLKCTNLEFNTKADIALRYSEMIFTKPNNSWSNLCENSYIKLSNSHYVRKATSEERYELEQEIVWKSAKDLIISL